MKPTNDIQEARGQLPSGARLVKNFPTVPVLEKVQRIAHEVFDGTGAVLYLFGSWGRDQATRSSDIDIAVDAPTPLPPGLLAHLRERFEESNIPYRVEVVDLRKTDSTFRERVLSEGIRWTD